MPPRIRNGLGWLLGCMVAVHSAQICAETGNGNPCGGDISKKPALPFYGIKKLPNYVESLHYIQLLIQTVSNFDILRNREPSIKFSWYKIPFYTVRINNTYLSMCLVFKSRTRINRISFRKKLPNRIIRCNT